MSQKGSLIRLVSIKPSLAHVGHMVLQVCYEPQLYLAIIANLVFVLVLSTVVPPLYIPFSIILAMAFGALLGIAEYIATHTLRAKPRGWLSNIYGLAILSAATYTALLLNLSSVWVAFFVGMVIALNSAIWGDLFIKGHFDAWLWVLTNTQIGRMRQLLRSRLHEVVTVYLLFPVGAYVVAFFHLWAVFSPTPVEFAWITSWDWLSDREKLSQVGCILLYAFVIWLSATCLVAMRKYHLLTSGSKIGMSHKSITLLWQKISRRAPNPSANLIIKEIQRDQLLWAIILAIVIAVIETAVYLLYSNERTFFNFVFFMVPLTVVLVFGSIGHTTSTELGGAYGVMLSALSMRVISLLLPQYSWNGALLFIIFWSAIIAWIVSLLGAKLLKGTQQMALLAFVIQIDVDSEALLVPRLTQPCEKGLSDGYQNGISKIFERPASAPKAKIVAGTNIVFSASDGVVLLGDDVLHMTISYKQIPVLQQIRYALCFNELVTRGNQHLQGPITLPDSSIILPVLPIEYFHPGVPRSAIQLDAAAQSNGTYRMAICHNRWAELDSFMPSTQATGSYGYRKQASEFFDQMLTRSVYIKTDLFCSIEKPSDGAPGPTQLLLVGFCRCQTSTKSYVTLEAEIITSEVLNTLSAELQSYNPKIQRARLYYPKISIYDHGFDPDAFDAQGYSSATNSTPILAGTLSATMFKVIKGHLEKLTGGTRFTTFTQIVRQRLLIAALEVGATSLVASINFNPSVVKLLTDFVHSLLS